ncbi:hypothetical protein, partial [Arhodomonas sp. AD133]|uniref:hypothetical protein n=1 Tax=Arhodomonas sp. AD133 TaxID=3415009 RepID=UPI003EB97FB3
MKAGLDRALERHGLTFAELQRPAGLVQVDARFRAYLDEHAPGLGQRLSDYRAGASLTAIEVSELLLALGPELEAFIAELFGIEA